MKFPSKLVNDSKTFTLHTCCRKIHQPARIEFFCGWVGELEISRYGRSRNTFCVEIEGCFQIYGHHDNDQLCFPVINTRGRKQSSAEPELLSQFFFGTIKPKCQSDWMGYL